LAEFNQKREKEKTIRNTSTKEKIRKLMLKQKKK